MECINKTTQEWLGRCWNCDQFDPVSTVVWRSCTHPDRYSIDESLVLSIDCLDDSIEVPDLSTLDIGALPINCVEDRSVKPDYPIVFEFALAETFPFYYIDNGCPLEAGVKL